MLLSVERPFVGAFAFVIPGATLLHCERSGASSPAGVGLEHVQTDNWGSPGTWEAPGTMHPMIQIVSVGVIGLWCVPRRF